MIIIKKIATTALAVTLLCSCMRDISQSDFVQRPNLIDPKLNMERGDYEYTKPTKDNPEVRAQSNNGDVPPIPDSSPILITPQPPKVGSEKMVSISVTEDVPLKDVLMELSRLADVDLEMDKNISGGIIFKATNKPFSEVITRICDMAGLRYSLDKGVLRVAVDEPYVVNYQLDFLNLQRDSKGEVKVNTSVLSGGGSSGSSGGGGGGEGSSGGDGFGSGSKSEVTTASENDLWQSFEGGIQSILSVAATTPGSEGATAPAQATGAAAGTQDQNQPFYVINRQAGIITVKASESKHKKVKEYINRIKSSASSQVLIEAKIVEVTLDKNFQSGINWQTLFDPNWVVAGGFGSIDPTNTNNVVSFAINPDAGLNLNTVVRLTENFGTSRTLSSPRITAINNQQAVLTFAENLVYFEISVDRETNNTSGTNQQLLTVDSEVKTVPIGIIMTIQPSIDADGDEVTLNVRPTLSRVTDFVEDPSVAFLASQGEIQGNIPANLIPVVEVREIDSILKIQSGQIMIIGGLMEEKSTNNDSGVPVVSSMPVIGNLFKARDRRNELVELVIFIKATIVPTSGNVHQADKELYKNFTADPRPLVF